MTDRFPSPYEFETTDGPQSQPAPAPAYMSECEAEEPEPCSCEESLALRARIAELEAREGGIPQLDAQIAEANARADAAERSLIELKEAWAESDEGNMVERIERAEYALTDECAETSRLREENQMLRKAVVGTRGEVDEVKELWSCERAETARLRAEKREANMLYGAERADRQEAEKRLAAATKLLAEISESQNTGRSWRGAIRPLLSAQPAPAKEDPSANPKHPELMLNPTKPAPAKTFDHPGAQAVFERLAKRSAADKAVCDAMTRTPCYLTDAQGWAVLNAMNALEAADLGLMLGDETDQPERVRNVARAELARREAKP